MTAATLTRQRCWVHLEREAAARCPVCTHFYCRECVTEHDGRVICAACLRGLLAAAATRRTSIGTGARRVLGGLVRAGQLAMGILLSWYFFTQLGQWLLTSTAEFHEAAVWKQQLFGGGSSDTEDKDSSGDDDARHKDKASNPSDE